NVKGRVEKKSQKPRDYQQDAAQRAEEHQLRQAGACQPQAISIPEWVVIRVEPKAADIPIELQIARIDDIVGTVRTISLSLTEHLLHIPEPEAAQVGAPELAPNALKLEAKASSRLDAGDGSRMKCSRSLSSDACHTK